MTPKALLTDAIDPAHAILAKVGIKSDDRARVLSLAIAGQESAWQYRVQIGGPARSFWQFERGGGVAGVFRVLPGQTRALCVALNVPYGIDDVYMQMADNDVLGAGMARLLLYSDPAALPAVGAVMEGWDYYQRNWRPGMPHPESWPARYGTAMGLVQNNPVVGVAA